MASKAYNQRRFSGPQRPHTTAFCSSKNIIGSLTSVSPAAVQSTAGRSASSCNGAVAAFGAFHAAGGTSTIQVSAGAESVRVAVTQSHQHLSVGSCRCRTALCTKHGRPTVTGAAIVRNPRRCMVADAGLCLPSHRGSSAFVQKALDLRTGQEVAIKFIHRWPGAPSFDPHHLTRELLNHRLAGRHPNIVQLLEVSTTS